VRRSLEPREEIVGRGAEAEALLTAARAVLENRAFADAAKAILGACTMILGADGGLVAVSTADKNGFEVSCLDPGSLELDCAAGLPAPLDRLSARASKGRAVFANDLSNSTADVPPSDHLSILESALLAPIIIADDVAGLLGVFNGPGGFSEADTRLAEVFAELVAVALLRGRTLNGLEESHTALEREVVEGAAKLRESEQHFRTLVENLPDLIARFDADLRLLYVSPSVQSITNRPLRAITGKTKQELGLSFELIEPWDAALRKVFQLGLPEEFELAFPAPEGTRHFDCRLVPEPGAGGDIQSVLSVARDVTERRLAFDAAERARSVADALRQATLALTRSLDRETVLSTLLEHLRGIVPFDRASVMLLEEARRVSVRAIFDGDRVLPLPPDERSEIDPADHPVVNGILTTGSAVVIPDVRTYPGWSLPTDGSAEASWLGVPLFARGDVAGLFSLSKREAGYFNEEHVTLAEVMSSQASVAVENAILFQQMKVATVRMRMLSRGLIEAQESERRSLSRELHDEAGQALASLRYGLQLLEREVNGGENVTERLAALRNTTDAIIEGLRRLAADLRPASLDHLGLEAALHQLSDAAGPKFGLAVHFKARGFAGERLPPEMETALYRVVQEAISNVVRHAHATRVDILAERLGDRVMVMVEDDGVGFDQKRGQRAENLGLVGMHERVHALSGMLTVESAVGAGTTVVAEVPIAGANPGR
jgi:PAS domain S-box-containing protein